MTHIERLTEKILNATANQCAATSREIHDFMISEKIPATTLERVKKSLEITSYQMGGSWYLARVYDMPKTHRPGEALEAPAAVNLPVEDATETPEAAKPEVEPETEAEDAPAGMIETIRPLSAKNIDITKTVLCSRTGALTERKPLFSVDTILNMKKADREERKATTRELAKDAPVYGMDPEIEKFLEARREAEADENEALRDILRKQNGIYTYDHAQQQRPYHHIPDPKGKAPSTLDDREITVDSLIQGASGKRRLTDRI